VQHLPETDSGKVGFTTLQSWYTRRGDLPAFARPDARLAVVWDEAHWAPFSRIGRAFR
jgi:hypothetical protein